MAIGAVQWQRYFESSGGESSVIIQGATERAIFVRWS